jgi:phenylalanyl-tRNA synthetase alpha chain
MFSDLTDQLTAFGTRLREALGSAHDHAALEEVRVKFLGRSGEITAVRRAIGTLPGPERPAAGKAINDAVAEFEADLASRARALDARALEGELELAIDVTFPGPPSRAGSLHPMRRAMDDACGYFERRGFAVVLGPEIETDYYNFDALNIPPDHPAREASIRFTSARRLLLRTHTSPMQFANDASALRRRSPS